MIQLVKQKAGHIPIAFLCKHFGVSKSGYYNWSINCEPVSFKRKKARCTMILEVFEASGRSYGSPRVHKELLEKGVHISENTVAKYMNELGLDARYKKKFKVQTTDSQHSLPIAQRLIKTEDMTTLPAAPGQVLAGDITYLKYGENRFVYLAVVIDLFTREVLGWSMQTSLKTKIVLNALESAMQKVGPDAEVIFHSDRGSQYASEAFRKFCKLGNVLPSMSRRGNCYDNAYVESWFASLKKERIYRRKFKTEEELRADVFDYIEVWYSKRRKHSSLGYQSPSSFRKNHAA